MLNMLNMRGQYWHILGCRLFQLGQSRAAFCSGPGSAAIWSAAEPLSAACCTNTQYVNRKRTLIKFLLVQEDI